MDIEKYLKPELKSFSGKDVVEITGPVQTASINLLFQQVEEVSKLDIQPKHKIVRFIKVEYPRVYKYNNHNQKV